MNDLMTLVEFPNLDRQSVNDQCKNIEAAPGTGMSLCKCTTNLCNSSSKKSYFSFSSFFLFIYILASFFYDYFLH
jgi:hypothetical protein